MRGNEGCWRWLFAVWLCLYNCRVADSEQHSSNWAVLVCTSRDWRNYRHIANALSMYRTVKRLGIPDSHIILMLADDIACNARNTFPASVFNNKQRNVDLYGSNVETDYRGYEVTVENFIRVLTGRHDPALPASKRLLSNSESNILIYLTGHGGNGFLNFQSREDLLSKDIASALTQMHEKRRYHEILLMVDTCQAASLFTEIRVPNVIRIGSSKKGESSYSYHTDPVIGVSLIDRFTLATLIFFEGVDAQSNATMMDLLNSYARHQLMSTMEYSSEGFERDLSRVLVTDFFGHVARTHVIKQSIQLLRVSYSLHNLE